MGERNFPGVEEVACVPAAAPVERIPDDRVAKVLEVDADLVGSAGAGLAFHEGFSFEGGDDAVVRGGFPSALAHRHFLPVNGVPADGRLDFSMWHTGDALDECKVGFFD